MLVTPPGRGKRPGGGARASETTRLPKWHPDNPARPATKKCSGCGKHKVPGVDFDWRTERGVRYPMSACKACISDRKWDGQYHRVTPVRPAAPEGTKWCPQCERHRDLGEFGRDRRRADGRSPWCRPCAAAYRRAGVAAMTDEQRADFLARKAASEARNPESRKRRYLAHAFHMTLEDYERMYAEQKGLCALCGRPETAKRKDTLIDLSVDHDHACCPEKGRSCGRCIRRLLCGNCNKGLGCFQDDPELLRAALRYLEEASTRP